MLLKADATSAGLRRFRAGPRDQRQRHRCAGRPGPAAVPLSSLRNVRSRTVLDTAGRPIRRTTQRSWRCSRCWLAGQHRGQRAHLARSAAGEPGDVPALEQLASILSDIGDAERLEPVVQRLAQEAPKSTWSHYYAATSLFFQQTAWTSRSAGGTQRRQPRPVRNAKAQNLIGARSLASMGQPTRRAPPSRLAQGRPARARHLFQPGTLELQAGNRRTRPPLLRRSADDRSHQQIARKVSRPRSRNADRIQFAEASIQLRLIDVDSVRRCVPLDRHIALCKKLLRQRHRAISPRTNCASFPLSTTTTAIRAAQSIANIARHREDYFDERRSHSGVLDAVVRVCGRTVPGRCQHARGQLRGRKGCRLRKPRAPPQPHGVGRSASGSPRSP